MRNAALLQERTRITLTSLWFWVCGVLGGLSFANQFPQRAESLVAVFLLVFLLVTVLCLVAELVLRRTRQGN